MYDIFLSYRRKDAMGNSNVATARTFKLEFERRGMKVFFDYSECTDDYFSDKILPAIRTCRYFVLVLTKDCLDRCKNEGDWLRREIAEAIKFGRKIIPISPDGVFEGWPKDLPEAIGQLSAGDGLQITTIHMDRVFESNVELLIQDRMGGMMKRETERWKSGAGTYLKVTCNLDCVMYIDGEEYGTLSAGRLQKIPLSEGEYMLTFESVENRSDRVILEKFEMPNKDKLYNVDLKKVKDERKQRNQENHERITREFRERVVSAQKRVQNERDVGVRKPNNKKIESEVKKKKTLRNAILITLLSELVFICVSVKVMHNKVRHIQVNSDFSSQVDKRIEKIGDEEFTMEKVKGGTFMMGAQGRESSLPNYDTMAFNDEYLVHKVTLDSYYISETVVTQALWKEVMKSEPTFNGGWTEQYGRGDNYPAYMVCYDDVQDFIKKLNGLTGRKFRLPTEAEWEYAARGGHKSKGYKYSGSNNIDEVAWYDGNSGNKTHPVKGKKANELGLYDMSGNVWEWCNDWYVDYGKQGDFIPKNTEGYCHVLRGGDRDCDARHCRVSNRGGRASDYRSNSIGFRLVLCP